MKAKDLMIGDWMYALYPSGKPTPPFRIHAVDIYPLNSSPRIVTSGGYGYHEESLLPIPLTPEILEKNGFKNDFYEEESVADYHTIRLEGYSLKHKIGKIDGYLVTWCNGGVNVTTDLHGCVQKDISYVHELQHALKLCGIEKEIVL